jgi:hypothetical protein
MKQITRLFSLLLMLFVLLWTVGPARADLTTNAPANVVGPAPLTTNYSRTNLSSLVISTTNYSRTNLSSLVVSTTNYSRTNLSGALTPTTNYSRTNLSSLVISTTNYSRTNLSGALTPTTNYSRTNLAGQMTMTTNYSGTNLSGQMVLTTNAPNIRQILITNYFGIVTNAGWTLTLTAPQGFNFYQGVFENSNLVQVVGGNTGPEIPTNTFTLNLTTNEWKAGWMNLGYGPGPGIYGNSINFDIPFSGISNTVGNYFAMVPWTDQNQFNAIYNSNSLAGQQLYLTTTVARVQIITTNYY